MSLTSEQIRLFRHNGFLKLPEPIPEEAVTRLRDAIWHDVRAEVEPVVRDRQGRVVRLSNLWDRDPIFRETVTSPVLLDALESLLGPNIELIRNRHNHATLRTAGDGGVYMHRDVLQWSRPILTVIFYLEETTVENGCTHLIPGTHLLPGLASASVAEDEEIQRSGVLDQAVPVPMPAGGMIAMNSLVMHTAGTNRTEGTRMSMTVGYHSVDELSDVPNPKRVLVRGTRPYMGNDVRAK
jgi:phytanoyl-CoA hydroxylase